MPLSNPRRAAAQYENSSNLDSRTTLHQRFSVNATTWHEWAFTNPNLPDDARILELDRGNAAPWIENRHKTPKTWRVTLTHSSPGITEEARKSINFKFRNMLTRNFRVISTEAQGIPFGGEGFERRVSRLSERPEGEVSENGEVRVAKGAGVFVAKR